MLQPVISIAAALASVGFALSGVRRGVPARFLSAALLCLSVQEIADTLAFFSPEQLAVWRRAAFVAEGVMAPAWLAYAMTFAREAQLGGRRRALLFLSLAFPAAAVLLPFAGLFYSPDFGVERILFLERAGFVFYAGLLSATVFSLVNLESTLRSAAYACRWRIKYEAVGAGAILAVLVFYYSRALVGRSIDMNLVPLRGLVTMGGLLLIGWGRVRRSDGVGIRVSSSIAYRSVVLLAVGGYLIFLGVIGEGMKYLGGDFGRALTLAPAFFVGAVFVAVILSERVRRQIKITLQKNFYGSKYDYRVQWLQFTDRLATTRSHSELLRAVTEGFCDLFGMGSGILYLIGRDGDAYRAAAGVTPEQGPDIAPCDPLVQSVTRKKWIVRLGEGDVVPGGEAGSFFTSISALFVVPFFEGDGLMGFLVMGNPLHVGEEYTYEDYDLMTALARQAASAVAYLQISEELGRAREMEAVGRLSTFVLHDLKNVVYSLSLAVDNARDHIADPEFQEDMLDSLRNSVARMNRLISKLKRTPAGEEMRLEPTDLLALVEETAILIPGDIRINGFPVVARVDREEVQKVALNLLLNAVEATGGAGPVDVEVGKAKNAYIRITDEGCGMTPDFIRNMLFRPFCTTKKKGLGIGLFQCKQIIEAHGGKIDVTSEVGRGTVFTAWLPTG